jgi:pathogenesis-related protein 1
METRPITVAVLCLTLAACGDIDTTGAAGSLRAKLKPGASIKAPPVHLRESAKKLQRAELVRDHATPPKDAQPSDEEAAPPEAAEPPPPPPREEKGKLAGVTDAHNAVRTPLNIPKLEWSDAIGGFAQQWADYLAIENGCKLQHRPSSGPWGQKYGENIFWRSAPTTVDEAVNAWSAEAADYDHATNTCAGICGHYTQMVWAKTRYLGCGVAACPGGGEMWVCNYDPRGNYFGQAPY